LTRSAGPAGSSAAPLAVVVVALALAALHFTLVVAWLLPGALVPPALRRVAHAYVAPVFAQNWWLFAPDPPPLDRQVEARGFYADARGRAATAWLPLTATATAAVQRRPLASDNGSWVVLLNAMYGVADPNGVLRLRGGARELVLRSLSEPARQPATLVVLERAGAAALRARHPGLRFEAVQVRVLVRRLPPPHPPGAGIAGAGDELRFPPVPFAASLPGGAGGGRAGR
jgi:hypothetical protein